MGVTQWVLIAFIVVLLIAYPLLMSRRNKIENQKMQEQANSLKRGDEVITSAGVYGKVLEVKQDGEAKKVVIETGSDKNKSFLTVDAYSIYAVLNKKPAEPVKEKKEEVKNEELKKEPSEITNESKVVDEKKEEPKKEKTSLKTSKPKKEVKNKEKKAKSE